jgi:SAM-dependent methyltransferase
MGISLNIATQLARIAPHLKDCRKGVMLGRQKMHLRRPGWQEELVRRLNAIGHSVSASDILQEDGFCETFLSAIGWPPMQSADFTPMEGAEHVFDLGGPLPPDLRNGFDLVYDGGTTEHVFDIAQAFRNVDAMLREGGVFVSNVGADGWFGHGFYQIGPDIPWRYWVASLGYEMIECCTFDRAGKAAPEPVPDPTGVPGGGFRRFDRPQFLFYAVRKRPRAAAPASVVQSHYVAYPRG